VKLLYSREAIADLDRLRAFIAEHDPSVAQRIVDGLIERLQRLSEFPGMGRTLEGTPKTLDIREFTFGSYAVRYVTPREALVVLRLWHRLESRRVAD
jgi:plasmid stabilization system protein ParE